MKPSLIIIGLGNPGKDYESTRHNVGFLTCEKLSEEFGEGDWQPKQKFLADVCEARIVTFPILLVKPTTYMNRSGECVKKLIDFYKLDPVTQILIVCDDIDIAAGELRHRESGGAGSHNGLKSIVEQYGESFHRIRVGVLGEHAPQGSFQQAGEDLSTYILSRPSKEDQEKIEEAITTIPEVVREFVVGSD
jgi:PTH1 family peptidyl-tRNA hydrolase